METVYYATAFKFDLAIKSTYTASGQKIVSLFKYPALASAWQTGQPMHSLSAKTEHLQTYFNELTKLFLLDPV